MKKIINFLKTLVYGILPAISGGLIVLNTIYIIHNIKSISTGTGWSVVLFFILATIEIVLAVCLLYGLGITQVNANKWIAYKKEITTQTIDSSASDNETSDKATDVSSNKKSNNKHKKS